MAKGGNSLDPRNDDEFKCVNEIRPDAENQIYLQDTFPRPR